MNPFAFLLFWYNIPFSAALALSILLAVLQLAGGFGDSDADVDVDAEIDVDADAAVDSEADTGTQSGGSNLLSALGFGKVPFLLVLAALLGSLGALGLIFNSLLGMLPSYPAWLFPLVLIGAFLPALPLTRLISGLLARLAPQSTTAVRLEQLVGRAGIVVSPSVSSTYGRVMVRDAKGGSHTVFAVVEQGEQIPEQSEVALLAYDAGQQRFVVRALRRS